MGNKKKNEDNFMSKHKTKTVKKVLRKYICDIICVAKGRCDGVILCEDLEDMIEELKKAREDL